MYDIKRIIGLAFAHESVAELQQCVQFQVKDDAGKPAIVVPNRPEEKMKPEFIGSESAPDC